MLEEVYLTGDDAQEAFRQLQTSTNLTLTMAANGKVDATGNAEDTDDQKLLTAINDKNVIVNITANKNSKFDFNGKPYQTQGGSFLGNKIKERDVLVEELGVGPKEANLAEKTIKETIVEANQFVCPNLLEDFDIFAGTYGKAIEHEVTEAFTGGVIALKSGKASPSANFPNSTYVKAHEAKTTVKQPGDGIITQDDLNKIRTTK